jgi:Protein of unknown function (DUF1329)
MTLNRFATTIALALAIAVSLAIPGFAQVQPGDVITPSNASKVQNLVSPGNFTLVKQGMTMKITPTAHLDWPPPYKAATEQYSPQVTLGADGDLQHYVAGLPFPLVDANDPQAATKIMWNFEFRPLFTDDIDTHNIEATSHRAGSSSEIEHFTFGHFGAYKYIGRTEVAPMPVDPDVLKTGIAVRAGAFPILEPQEMAGAGIVTQRSVLPGVEDAVWEYSRETRRLRRLPLAELADAFGVASDGSAGSNSGGSGGATTYASTWDPDSAYGFSGRIQDYNYKLLGEEPILASVDGSSPATPCESDGGRSVCPEKWQVRRVYVIEATAKKLSPLAATVLVPRRVLYIDAEGWFITASDLYDQNGRIWKTIANFHAYSDRSTPNANVSIWPFKRIFQTAMVEEDVTDGFSTVVYTPGLNSHNGVYVNMGAVDRDFFTPAQMVQSSR